MGDGLRHGLTSRTAGEVSASRRTFLPSSRRCVDPPIGSAYLSMRRRMRPEESPKSVPRWRAGDFLWRKESHQRNTQVQFEPAVRIVAGIFRRGVLPRRKTADVVSAALRVSTSGMMGPQSERSSGRNANGRIAARLNPERPDFECDVRRMRASALTMRITHASRTPRRRSAGPSTIPAYRCRSASVRRRPGSAAGRSPRPRRCGARRGAGFPAR